MFLALRDIRFARGRFLLMGSVIALITLLVGLLSGLTAGLGDQNVSAVRDLKADHLIVQTAPDGSAADLTTSTISDSKLSSLQQNSAGTFAPIGTTQGQLDFGDARRSATLIGFDDAALAPTGVCADGSCAAPGTVRLSETLADELNASEGATVEMSGKDLTVAGIVPDTWLGHTPVAWTSVEDWHAVAATRLGPGADSMAATALVATTTDANLPDGLTTLSGSERLNAIGSYASENGSLQAMRAFLVAISALVIGAFFTVWTIQRQGDIAIAKALGGTNNRLLRDALGQAVLVLVVGIGAGTLVAAALGLLLDGVLPFVLEPLTLLVPAAGMAVLGLVGAAVAVVRVTRVDPLTALGASR